VHAGITIVSTIYVIVASRKVRVRGTAGAIIDARARAAASEVAMRLCIPLCISVARSLEGQIGRTVSACGLTREFRFSLARVVSPNTPNASGYTHFYHFYSLFASHRTICNVEKADSGISSRMERWHGKKDIFITVEDARM